MKLKTKGFAQETSGQPSEEESKAYLALAKKSFHEKILLTQKAIDENQEFAAISTAPINSDELKSSVVPIFATQFAITSVYIHSWISTNTPLHFPEKQDIRFNADVWGIGLGGGVVWLSGWLSPAQDILGDVKFSYSTNVAHTEIAFFKGITPVGVLVGAGINAQVGTFAGSGTFSNW